MSVGSVPATGYSLERTVFLFGVRGMLTGVLAWALAVIAVLFAAISKAGFGSGAAFAGATILALVLPPQLALGTMLPLLMLVDLTTLAPYWRRWHLPDALRLIAGGIPGIAAGVLVLQLVSADGLRLGIGGISLAFVAWKLFGRISACGRVAKGWAWPAGAVAGLTSFVSHAGGPPVAMYLLARGHDKLCYQATTVFVFWAINLGKAVPYAAMGFFTQDTLTMALMLAPVALLGSWVGVRCHRLVPERVFFALTYALLVLTGLKLIWDGLT